MSYLVTYSGIQRLVELESNARRAVLLPRLRVSIGTEKQPDTLKLRDAVLTAVDAAVSQPVRAAEEVPMRLLMQLEGLQGLRSAEAEMRAEYAVVRTTPVTGHSSQEVYTLLASGRLEGELTLMLGAEVTGITTCPCAHEGIRERARERLLGSFPEQVVDRILSILPIASHNQRNISTLMLGTAPGRVQVEQIIEVVEESMSSRLYEVLKREDEVEVVYRAHLNPNFVEDTVRGILLRTAERFRNLPDSTVVYARSESIESIHQHNAVAERLATLGEIRREVSRE